MTDHSLDAPIAMSVRDLLDIKTSLTKLTEQFASFAEAAEHRHSNLKMSLDSFMPRRETEAVFLAGARRMDTIELDLAAKASADDVQRCASKAQTDEIDRRLAKVEGIYERIVWGILATFGTAAASLIVLQIRH